MGMRTRQGGERWRRDVDGQVCDWGPTTRDLLDAIHQALADHEDVNCEACGVATEGRGILIARGLADAIESGKVRIGMIAYAAAGNAQAPRPDGAWQPTVPDDSETQEEALERVAHEAVGAGSSCWHNLRGAGTFDDARAGQVARGLTAWIRNWHQQAVAAIYAQPPMPLEAAQPPTLATTDDLLALRLVMEARIEAAQHVGAEALTLAKQAAPSRSLTELDGKLSGDMAKASARLRHFDRRERRDHPHPEDKIGQHHRITTPYHLHQQASGEPHLGVNVHDDARTWPGSVLEGGVKRPTTIAAHASIGNDVLIGHDAILMPYVEVATRSVVGAHSVLEPYVKVGLSVTIKPFTTVGRGARIGNGSNVMADVPANQLWYGNPARFQAHLCRRDGCYAKVAEAGMACQDCAKEYAHLEPLLAQATGDGQMTVHPCA